MPSSIASLLYHGNAGEGEKRRHYGAGHQERNKRSARKESGRGMRIVIDTNVIASGILFGGKPDRLVSLLMEGKIEAYVSEAIVSPAVSVM